MVYILFVCLLSRSRRQSADPPGEPAVVVHRAAEFCSPDHPCSGTGVSGGGSDKNPHHGQNKVCSEGFIHVTGVGGLVSTGIRSSPFD